MLRQKSVLLLKTQKNGGADKYEELLTANGFEVSHVRTLVFEFKNINQLEEKLSNSNDYAGIILSSPRCVHAVELALNNIAVIENWKEKFNFVVGEATYSNAIEKLCLECKGKESGNSANLSKLILKEKDLYNKPFLFPHGNLKTDTLKLELGKEGLAIEGALVYDTIANPSIEKEIAEATNNFTSIPEYLVFFSPSGFRSAINHLIKIPMDLKNVKLPKTKDNTKYNTDIFSIKMMYQRLVCGYPSAYLNLNFPYFKVRVLPERCTTKFVFIAIGPVTELAIREENYEVHGVTKNPTPQDVLDVILKDYC